MDQQSEHTEQAALDWEALKARCLGNMALVDRVLAKFTGQLTADLDALEQAIISEDAEEAAQLAHRIKGTAGSVSARHLYENAERAEQRASKGQLSVLPEELRRMREDRLELVETIERMKQPTH